MYRLILAAAAAGFALLAVADANAADVYPPRDRAGMDRLFSTVQATNWTGFYAGVNGGYSAGPDVRGFTGGGQLGYNYQLSSNWVVGIEADAQYSTQPDWWGTVRGRAGYLLTPDVLLYATAGWAYVLPTHAHRATSGWTAGGGIEYALNRNWSAKAEYLYVAPGGGQDANVVRAGINYLF